MAQTQLTLVVPGLLGPMSEGGVNDVHAPAVPSLLKLLNLARPTPAPGLDLESCLFPRFGIDRPRDGDWPVAALGAARELGDAADGYWLRADPVHLRPDRSRLILFGPDALAILPEEADALVAGFNALYRADGWQLFAASPERWYLRLPDAPQFRTTPLQRVVGRHIDPFLPTGKDARRWHGLLNEMQMLLHGHTVNQQRAEAGRPAINSLWLWGGGRMPLGVQAADAWVCSDGELARSLAQGAGVDCFPDRDEVAAWLPQALGQGPGLVVLEACGRALQSADSEAWSQAMETLEQRWWQPLLALRRRAAIAQLVLQPLAGSCYTIGARHWLEGWGRRRGLRQFLV